MSIFCRAPENRDAAEIVCLHLFVTFRREQGCISLQLLYRADPHANSLCKLVDAQNKLLQTSRNSASSMLMYHRRIIKAHGFASGLSVIPFSAHPPHHPSVRHLRQSVSQDCARLLPIQGRQPTKLNPVHQHRPQSKLCLGASIDRVLHTARNCVSVTVL